MLLLVIFILNNIILLPLLYKKIKKNNGLARSILEFDSKRTRIFKDFLEIVIYAFF